MVAHRGGDSLHRPFHFRMGVLAMNEPYADRTGIGCALIFTSCLLSLLGLYALAQWWVG